jgi:hypothetical protein
VKHAFAKPRPTDQGSVATAFEKLTIVAEADTRIPALRLSAPSVRFIALAIFATGVRAFECVLSSLTSSLDHGLRCDVVFLVGTNNLPNALFE